MSVSCSICRFISGLISCLYIVIIHRGEVHFHGVNQASSGEWGDKEPITRSKSVGRGCRQIEELMLSIKPQTGRVMLVTSRVEVTDDLKTRACRWMVFQPHLAFTCFGSVHCIFSPSYWPTFLNWWISHMKPDVTFWKSQKNWQWRTTLLHGKYWLESIVDSGRDEGCFLSPGQLGFWVLTGQNWGQSRCSFKNNYLFIVVIFCVRALMSLETY